MARQADYSFIIPSLEDKISLSCRLYIPYHMANVVSDEIWPGNGLKGAIVAHPYAVMHGSYNDLVVLTIVDALLKQNYVVATFNFRGAPPSGGSTSWTGKPEITDYASVVGLLTYFLEGLELPYNIYALRPVISWSTDGFDDGAEPPVPRPAAPGIRLPIRLLLAGYSYGSLIVARLPPLESVLKRFDGPDPGSAAFEILSLAKHLAGDMSDILQERFNAANKTLYRRGYNLFPPGSLKRRRSRSLPVTIGAGEERKADSSRRRRENSEHTKRPSEETVRETSVHQPIGRRVKAYLRHRTSQLTESHSFKQKPAVASNPSFLHSGHSLSTAFLLVSPVLNSLTADIMTPGVWLPYLVYHPGVLEPSGFKALTAPTLILFGENDIYSSGKRVTKWAKGLEERASARELVQWQQYARCNHFWNGLESKEALEERLAAWAGEL